MLQVPSESAQKTIYLGQKLAQLLKPGDVIRLEGDLGAGKTTFTQGVCAGLGVTTPVTSPTFTILHIYEGGRLPVYHIDAYRIEDFAEIDELGLEEFLDGQGVSMVEWAEKIQPILPASYLQVELTYGLEEGEREISFTPVGSGRYVELVEELAQIADFRAR